MLRETGRSLTHSCTNKCTQTWLWSPSCEPALDFVWQYACHWRNNLSHPKMREPLWNSRSLTKFQNKEKTIFNILEKVSKTILLYPCHLYTEQTAESWKKASLWFLPRRKMRRYKWTSTAVQEANRGPIFHWSIIHNSQVMGTPKSLSKDEWIKKMCNTHIHTILIRH